MSTNSNLASLVNYPTSEVQPAEVTKPATCSSMDLYGQFCQKGLWLFLIVAIIVLVVIAYISKGAMDKDGFWSSLNMWNWGKNATVWGVMMTVGVLLFAWAAWTAYSTQSDPTTKNMILAGFGLSMVLLVVWFTLFFRKNKDGDFVTTGHNAASYVSIFAAAVGFLTLYPMWKSGNSVRLAMVPYLVWVTFAAALTSNVAKSNNSQ